MEKLRTLDKSIIRLIQGDLPMVKRPYQILAKRLRVSEETLIKRISWLKNRGYIRRFGATLRHRKAGLKANGMIVWKIPPKKAERIGKILAGFREVTHCYERPSFDDWPYNIFTMVHGRTKRSCQDIAKRFSKAVGIKDYMILFSSEEYKKTSMRYFL